MSAITVVIPTFRRPAELRRAAMSTLAQSFDYAFQLLIVDNDPEGSARQVANELALQAPDRIRVHYVHEPNAGVANARNAAIANVDTRLVAFLDDDQSVPETWLSKLFAFHHHNPAAVTFGPVVTKLPDDTCPHGDYLKAFFAREPEITSGYIDHFYGCGNSMLDLKLIGDQRPLFDTAMNDTGGEDDVLFQNLSERGLRFGWCQEAPAFEHVPLSRATLAYTLKRAFAYGQGPITLARKSTPPQYGKIGMWMAIGAGKAALNGLIYSAYWVVRAPTRARFLDEAVRGAGKVFWWKSLSFYGNGALERENA